MTTRIRLVLAVLIGAGLLVVLTATSAVAASCPNEAARKQQGVTSGTSGNEAEFLPECRGFERVSPAFKNNEEVSAIVGAEVSNSVNYQAAASGGRAFYLFEGGIPGAGAAVLYPAAISSRGTGAGSWETNPLGGSSQFSHLEREGNRAGNEWEYLNPQETCGVQGTVFAEAHLPGETVPDLPSDESASEELSNVYVTRLEAEAGHQAGENDLVTEARPQGPLYSDAGPPKTVGASTDCEHVFIQSSIGGYQYPIEPGSSTYGPDQSIYEWSSSGGLRLASVLPNGKPAVDPTGLGFSGTPAINEVSENGDRVFFSASQGKTEFEPEPEVFMHMSGGGTVEISASETATPNHRAVFLGASANGHRAFFLADYGLTAESSSGSEAAALCVVTSTGMGKGCDLYEYDADRPEGQHLRDLSVDKTDTKGAQAIGLVGLSSDGTVVYFSATGQLIPGEGNTQAVNEEATETKQPEANLYAEVLGPEGSSELKFVGVTTAAEAGNGEEPNLEIDSATGNEERNDQYEVARVSPDGGYLLFATSLPDTGYDNINPISKAPETELFEYSLAAGTVTCVSCAPSGEAPSQAANEAIGKFSSPYAETRGSYDSQVRYLLNDGRVFFGSHQPLVAKAAETDDVNVYEWQPEGISGCTKAAGCVYELDTGYQGFPTLLEGVSEDGTNVYIATQGALSPEDTDGSRDLYDVSVDGGRYIEPLPLGCGEGTEPKPCRGAGTSPPSEAARTSELVAANESPEEGVQGEAEVESFKKATVAIKRHSVKGSTLTLVLEVPAKGKVTIKGSKLTTLKRSFAKAGTYTLKIRLGAVGRTAVRHHKKVKVSVRVSYTPASGKPSAKTLKVTFH